MRRILMVGCSSGGFANPAERAARLMIPHFWALRYTPTMGTNHNRFFRFNNVPDVAYEPLNGQYCLTRKNYSKI